MGDFLVSLVFFSDTEVSSLSQKLIHPLHLNLAIPSLNTQA